MSPVFCSLCDELCPFLGEMGKTLYYLIPEQGFVHIAHVEHVKDAA
jgi:hypothetical protein